MTVCRWPIRLTLYMRLGGRPAALVALNDRITVYGRRRQDGYLAVSAKEKRIPLRPHYRRRLHITCVPKKDAPDIRFWKDSEGVTGILPPTRPKRRSNDSCTDSTKS